MDKLAATIEGVRKGLGRLIESAIFNNSDYFNVHLYNLASIAILSEMQMLFDDVDYQLGNNKAEAIELLCEVCIKLKENMGIFYEQVNRGTLN